MDLKPKLTPALWVDIKRWAATRAAEAAQDPPPATPADFPPYERLMDGTVWENHCGQQFELSGMKRALAYYVQARYSQGGSYDLSRMGQVEKLDAYTAVAEAKQRRTLELDATRVADTYMTECLLYLAANACDLFPLFDGRTSRVRNNARFRVIGD